MPESEKSSSPLAAECGERMEMTVGCDRYDRYRGVQSITMASAVSSWMAVP